jgi:hypothetical protein
MAYADPHEQQELIAGLRALADFLASNPEVPAPKYTYLHVFPLLASDSENRREIDAIAARIGSGTETSSPGGHYITSRAFGPVEYRAVAIPASETKDSKK